MELALVLPVLLTMLLGSVELGRYVMLHPKLDRVAVTMTDLVARSEALTEDQLDDLFRSAREVAQPFDFDGRGAVIVSSVINRTGLAPTIAWQRTGGGGLRATSRVGGLGGIGADLPDDFDLRRGESVIITEVFYDFEFCFNGPVVDLQRTLYRRAYHRPRYTMLDAIEDG